jgi:hypothetical protein
MKNIFLLLLFIIIILVVIYYYLLTIQIKIGENEGGLLPHSCCVYCILLEKPIKNILCLSSSIF